MNKIGKIIQEKATNGFPFKPNTLFFKEIGVGKRKFWQIMRNETQPNLDEVERIAKVLNVAPKDLTNL